MAMTAVGRVAGSSEVSVEMKVSRAVGSSVGVGTSEVKGTAPSEAVLAPVKAGVVVDGLGVALVALGLRTL
jgi:hypothetical protein